METDDAARIAELPAYRELVTQRGRLTAGLSAGMMVAYFGFVLLVAFVPDWLGRPVVRGNTLSIGIVLGFGLILLAILLTGVYVRAATRRFDPLVAQIRADANRDHAA